MCTDCDARRKMARDALMNAALGKAIVHVSKGAAELVGIKEKTGAAELAAQDASAEADAAAEPEKPASRRRGTKPKPAASPSE